MGATAARASPCATTASTSRHCSHAVTPQTKVVFVCHPNNPTGTMCSRAELDAYFERVPEHVLTVADQAYSEYIDDPDYPDAIAEYAKAGIAARPAHVLQDLRARGTARRLRRRSRVRDRGDDKVRRAFDVSTPGQEMALASLDAPDELARRPRRPTPRALRELERIPARARLRPGALRPATSSTSRSATTPRR